jgi:hypothetical protein
MPVSGTGRGDVPSAWAAALEQVIDALDLSQQVAEWVLTGQHIEAMKTVGSGDPVDVYNRWNGAAHNKVLVSLYAGFGEVDAVVLRRWGWVLDAALGIRAYAMHLGGVAGRHWPELMLNQAAAGTPSGPLPFSFADLERIAAVDGTPPASLIRMAFTYGRRYNFHIRSFHGYLARLPGFADAAAAHRDIPASALGSDSVEGRVAAATLLGMLGEPALSALCEPLVDAATCTKALVREAARPAIDQLADAAVGPLRALATEGTLERRGHALELLAARQDQRSWAIQTAAADRAASVRALSAGWAAADALAAAAEPLTELPPLPSWSLAAADAETVATMVYEAARRWLESYDRRAQAQYRRLPNSPSWPPTPEPPRGTIGRLASLLAADDPAQASDKLDRFPGHLVSARQLADAVHEQACPAAAAIQVMAVLGWLKLPSYGLSPWAEVVDEVHARADGPDLLTVQRMLDAVGVDGRALVWSAYSEARGFQLGRDWPDDDVWPFAAHNLQWIVEESSSQQSWRTDEHARYAAIATLPALPDWLVDRLYTLAVGPAKSERAPAQAVLERDPLRTTRAAAALQDGKSDVRLAAAQWLARIADPAARPALQSAWQQEKLDIVRGALLDALTAIGEDTATYLDPATTSATAAKFVAGGLPPSLAWLDWGSLPRLTWASSGETVPMAVVQWLCGTAVKAKSPEPDAVLRHYAALFDAGAREALASDLLAGWLQEDVLISPAQAQERAAAKASRAYGWYSSPSGPYPGMSLDQVTAALLPAYLKRPAGSATASRGLLAVVAACAGRDVVPPAERYLNEWYGQRAAQGKALIAMLAWVDHPSATQLVLSVGSGFRTKSFQDEAARQAGALAERNGWTVDELADRTIPTAGFDAGGVLELPYGPRAFTAVLRPGLTVELRDPDGKVISALPAPRQSDDADQAHESKKAFSAAKKELKAIAALQAQRLYAAMCTQRSWAAADWDRYLLRHPVAGPGVRRLAWVAQTADGAPVAFRPLDDGTLTDSGDNAVELPDGARVRVAHDSVLPVGEVAQWTAHFADYEVTPLFQQLGRGAYAITPEMRLKRELTDFTGHVVEAFALRGSAGRLGYHHGQPRDGGWFFTYEKRFPALGIVAIVNFTGNWLPEENRLVALKELSFHRETAAWYCAGLRLGQVPAVLVSECWQDLRLLAAGTGFDPEWEKKTES